MRRLLDDLLWLSRFDARHGQPDAEPVDLGILAAQAVDRFHAIAEARHLTLTLDAPEGQIITAPPDWLDRLLGVLLDNACKYSPEGAQCGRQPSRPMAAGSTLTVDDAGPGIPEEERGRIFDRFHRATESEFRRRAGPGHRRRGRPRQRRPLAPGRRARRAARGCRSAGPAGVSPPDTDPADPHRNRLRQGA